MIKILTGKPIKYAGVFNNGFTVSAYGGVAVIVHRNELINDIINERLRQNLEENSNVYIEPGLRFPKSKFKDKPYKSTKKYEEADVIVASSYTLDRDFNGYREAVIVECDEYYLEVSLECLINLNISLTQTRREIAEEVCRKKFYEQQNWVLAIDKEFKPVCSGYSKWIDNNTAAFLTAIINTDCPIVSDTVLDITLTDLDLLPDSTTLEKICTYVKSEDPEIQETGWKMLATFPYMKFPVTTRMIIYGYAGYRGGKVFQSLGVQTMFRALDINKSTTKYSHKNLTSAANNSGIDTLNEYDRCLIGIPTKSLLEDTLGNYVPEKLSSHLSCVVSVHTIMK